MKKFTFKAYPTSSYYLNAVAALLQCLGVEYRVRKDKKYGGAFVIFKGTMSQAKALYAATYVSETGHERRLVPTLLARGWKLVDVNPNHFNCGHYPDYIVKFGWCEVALNNLHWCKSLAEQRAKELNAKSTAAWHHFLSVR